MERFNLYFMWVQYYWQEVWHNVLFFHHTPYSIPRDGVIRFLFPPHPIQYTKRWSDKVPFSSSMNLCENFCFRYAIPGCENTKLFFHWMKFRQFLPQPHLWILIFLPISILNKHTLIHICSIYSTYSIVYLVLAPCIYILYILYAVQRILFYKQYTHWMYCKLYLLTTSLIIGKILIFSLFLQEFLLFLLESLQI